MEALKAGEEIDYTGASGATDFDDNGDVKTPVEIWEFTDDGGIETVQLQRPEDIPAE